MIEQRRPAAARGAKQHHQLRGVKLEVDAAQRGHLDISSTVDLRQVLC